MAKQLVFMCGSLRSGSSLVHLMLDHHPKIQNPGEFDFLFDQVSDDGLFPNVDFYHSWLATHRIFQSKSLVIDTSLTYEELIVSFVQQLALSNSILVLNIHRSFHRIPFLFPDAKYIHLIRDPRDVARSSIAMGWAGNVYYGVDHWLATEKDWKQLEDKVQENQFIQLRFEELILSPERELTLVCDFIGVSYSQKMMVYADNSSYSKPDTSLVNQWKRKLSIRDVQYVELKASELMGSLGYELSSDLKIFIGVMELCRLKIDNRVFRVRFSINRYGLLLYFRELFARLLKLKEFRKKVMIKMNEIDSTLLK